MILCNVKASLKGKVSLGTEFYFVQILKSKLSDRKIIIVFKLKGDFKKSWYIKETKVFINKTT